MVREYVTYIAGRSLVYFDWIDIQDEDDVFCVLHSAAFAFDLYKHFERTRPGGNEINNTIDASQLPYKVTVTQTGKFKPEKSSPLQIVYILFMKSTSTR